MKKPVAAGPRKKPRVRKPAKRRGWARPSLKKAAQAAAERAARETPVDEPSLPGQKLQKILAQAGVGSRRLMETWIGEGKITVNGAPATIGMRVTARDAIQVGPKKIRWPGETEAPRVLLYHKPEGEIVSREDPEGRATVYERLPRVRGGRWIAIGRLDFNTSGLLIFTTSGELANRMMHPRFEMEREYAVRTLGQLTEINARKLLSGVELDDGVARCEKLEDAGGEGSNHWYRIVLREGRNREVRRLFAAVGLTVSRLMRVRFGNVALPPRLKRGQFVELPPAGVKDLLQSLGAELPVPPPTPRVSEEKRSRPRRSSRAR